MSLENPSRRSPTFSDQPSELLPLAIHKLHSIYGSPTRTISVTIKDIETGITEHLSDIPCSTPIAAAIKPLVQRFPHFARSKYIAAHIIKRKFGSVHRLCVLPMKHPESLNVALWDLGILDRSVIEVKLVKGLMDALPTVSPLVPIGDSDDLAPAPMSETFDGNIDEEMVDAHNGVKDIDMVDLGTESQWNLHQIKREALSQQRAEGQQLLLMNQSERADDYTGVTSENPISIDDTSAASSSNRMQVEQEWDHALPTDSGEQNSTSLEMPPGNQETLNTDKGGPELTLSVNKAPELGTTMEKEAISSDAQVDNSVVPDVTINADETVGVIQSLTPRAPEPQEITPATVPDQHEGIPAPTTQAPIADTPSELNEPTKSTKSPFSSIRAVVGTQIHQVSPWGPYSCVFTCTIGSHTEKKTYHLRKTDLMGPVFEHFKNYIRTKGLMTDASYKMRFYLNDARITDKDTPETSRLQDTTSNNIRVEIIKCIAIRFIDNRSGRAELSKNLYAIPETVKFGKALKRYLVSTVKSPTKFDLAAFWLFCDGKRISPEDTPESAGMKGKVSIRITVVRPPS